MVLLCSNNVTINANVELKTGQTPGLTLTRTWPVQNRWPSDPWPGDPVPSLPHLIHGSLDPPESSTQTASRSV